MIQSLLSKAPHLLLAMAALCWPGCFDPPPAIETDDEDAGSSTDASSAHTTQDSDSEGSTALGNSTGTGSLDSGSTGSKDTSTGTGEPEFVCTNGVVDPGEECDDGNQVETDGCTNTCHHPICGDGIVHIGKEQCDDGNNIDTDDCLTSCMLATCGDDVVQDGEEVCDDGNIEPGDTCSANCQLAVCQSIVDTVEEPSCQECAGNGVLPDDQQCCTEAASCNLDCQCFYMCLFVGASPCSLFCPETDKLEQMLAEDLFSCIHQGPCSTQCPTS